MLGLVVLALAIVAVLLPLLGAPAMLMQAGGWVVAAMLGFLAIQFLVFRALDLRSRADETPDDEGARPEAEEAARDASSEWRAWRG